ncbi:hypothetical protein IFM89_010743 [Coptis chinensis]|uniref:Uncharacterized protein n=1 Tax=Coptis chinensis TaxID=261450 RepID=A0A835M578_9MAGN|nr:hypothetical protein IFM89_010743 [Coptis chinensis]
MQSIQRGLDWFTDSKTHPGAVSPLLQSIRDLGKDQYHVLGLDSDTIYPVLSHPSFYNINDHVHPLYRTPLPPKSSKISVKKARKKIGPPISRLKVKPSHSCQSHSSIPTRDSSLTTNFPSISDREGSSSPPMKFPPAPKLFPYRDFSDDDAPDPRVSNGPQKKRRSADPHAPSSTVPTALPKTSVDERGKAKVRAENVSRPPFSVTLRGRPLTSADSALRNSFVALSMFQGAHLPLDLDYSREDTLPSHRASFCQSLERMTLDALHIFRELNDALRENEKMVVELQGSATRPGLRSKYDEVCGQLKDAHAEIDTLKSNLDALGKSQAADLKKRVAEKEKELHNCFIGEISKLQTQYQREALEYVEQMKGRKTTRVGRTSSTRVALWRNFLGNCSPPCPRRSTTYSFI